MYAHIAVSIVITADIPGRAVSQQTTHPASSVTIKPKEMALQGQSHAAQLYPSCSPRRKAADTGRGETKDCHGLRSSLLQELMVSLLGITFGRASGRLLFCLFLFFGLFLSAIKGQE